MEALELSCERVRCALCGSDDHRLLWSIVDPDRQTIYVRGIRRTVTAPGHIVRCVRCGLVFVNPRILPQATVATYSDLDEDAYFDATRPARAVGNRKLLADLTARLGLPGRLLDVGCGDGLLLVQARAAGWRVAGVEIRARLVERLRSEQTEAQIHHGLLQDARFPDAAFDVVTLINVLEHVRDPLGMVAECRRIVRPGGLLVIHVPNVGGLPSRVSGPRWKHYEPLEHLYYFNRRTLRALLERCDLKVFSSFVLHTTPSLFGPLQFLGERLGLSLGNSLGLVACRPAGA